MTRGSTRRTNISSIRTRKKLSEALIEALGDKSFDKLTVMDICNAAGLPRATFYNHFIDKYDLLKYAFKTTAESIMPDSLPDIIDEKDCLKAITDNLMHYVEDHQELFRRVGSANINSLFFSEIKCNVRSLLKDFFDAKSGKGVNYKHTTFLLAEFYANALVFTVQGWIDSDARMDRNDFISSIMDLVVIDVL